VYYRTGVTQVAWPSSTPGREGIGHQEMPGVDSGPRGSLVVRWNPPGNGWGGVSLASISILDGLRAGPPLWYLYEGGSR
jgi:hypothetical protein